MAIIDKTCELVVQPSQHNPDLANFQANKFFKQIVLFQVVPVETAGEWLKTKDIDGVP